MYGESGGLFDGLEPSLRLMKPLPKRRRTASPPSTGTAATTTHARISSHHIPTAEALIAQADELAAQLEQYMPALDGAHDLLPLDHGPAAQAILDYVLDGAGTGVDADDTPDYADHAHARGNKKKRKVPAALAGHVAGSGGSDDSDERERDHERDGSGGGDGGDLGGPGTPGHAEATTPDTAQRRLSVAARAGLRRKAMVRERKKLLAAAFVNEENLDPVAIEHALTATFPFMLLEDQPRVRASRRASARLARIAKEQPPDALLAPMAASVPAPSGAFNYQCTSACEPASS
jgi:hypothetical protein